MTSFVRRHPLRTAIGASLLVLVALLTWSGVRLARGVREARESASVVQSLSETWRGVDQGSELQLATLQHDLARLDQQLSSARRHLTPFLQMSSAVSWFPGVGADIETSKDLLALGQHLVGASQTLLDALNSSIGANSADQSARILQDRQINPRIFEALSNQEPSLRAALVKLQEGERIQQRLERRELNGDAQEKVVLAGSLLSRIQVFGRMSLAAAQSWRPLLGFDGPRTYLIVAHNSDELRATGGFVPGAWLLTLDSGTIARLEFWDTPEVDQIMPSPPLPPQGLLETIWAGAWLFRDASWYPSFPDSAQVMERYFQAGVSQDIAGVIGANQWAVKELLLALGPVTLPSGQALSEGSFLSLLEDGTDTEGRAFMDVILQAVLNRLQDESTPYLMASVLAALNRSLDQKFILLSFDEPALQQMASSNGWDGALSKGKSDYLMVIDSNVGFNKVNRNIAREITYGVTLTPDGGSVRLDILYTNHSRPSGRDVCSSQGNNPQPELYESLKNGCYWNYLRVYVPEDSQLDGASPFPLPQGALYRRIGYNDIEETLRTYLESGRRVYAGFFTVGEGSSLKVAFQYRLPPSVVVRKDDLLTYRLLIQKQSGIQSERGNITIHFPQGYGMRTANVAPDIVEHGSARFTLILDTDKELSLVLERR